MQIRKSTARATIASLALLLIAATVATGQGVTLNLGTGHAKIRSVNDVIDGWNKDNHLYVKGDLGITQQPLNNLEQWLDQNAPHWTVVLMRNTRGESYESLDRRMFSGMDAVEYALGRGLALKTNFSELRDSRTGETDGAVFVLFHDERKFSYYASVAQDVRSLGESHWVGELDRPAFRAMRGGGRILDAVKDTITNINTRLTQKIVAEKEQAELELQARRRAEVNLRTDCEALKKSIQRVNELTAQLKQTYPDAAGELTTPPTEQWSRQVEEVLGMLTADSVPKSTESFNLVSNDVEGYLNSYAAYDTFDEAVAPIEVGIDEIRSHKLDNGVPLANEAAQHLSDARAAQKKGERGIETYVSKAEAAVTRGRTAIQEEATRIQRAEARRNLFWKTMMVTAGVLTLAFLGILAWLNRRRAPAMQRAHEAFTDREEKVGAEMEKVYELFDRTGEILGDKEKVKKRGYTGSTDKLSGNTFEDVDDLFVMSSEVERVMGEAREMIHPKSVGGKIANMFTGSRYEQGINRISGEPLEFHRDQGLPLVIQRESERTGTDLPESVTMTFDKVFEAFHERTTTAQETLATIENSLMQVDDNLKSLQSQIENTSALDRELAEAADDDGMLALPALFEKLIPAAQADFDEADEIATTDPVQATQVQIPRGSRKISEGRAIAETVQMARKDVFPKLNQFAPELQELEYNTNWIQQRVAQLGEHANGLLETAVNRSIADESKQFEADIVSLGEQVQQSVELAKALKSTDAPSLDELDKRIAEARTQIANTLSLPETSCLREYEAHPDIHLASGRKLFAAAQAALQHGGVDAAQQAQNTLREEVTTGHQLIEKSLEVLSNFDNETLKAKKQLDDVSDKIPRHEQLLSVARERYAPSALLLKAADPSYEDSTASVDTHMEGCRNALIDAHQMIKQASERFSEGKLIEADETLSMAFAEVSDGDTRLAEIAQHCDHLNAVSRENDGKLNAMLSEAEGFDSLVRERRTMKPTIEVYRRLVDEIREAQHELQHTRPRDPIQDGSAIDAFTENVANMKAQIEADHEAHAEAARAVAGATKEREIAEKLIGQARHDGIPDSAATTKNISGIRSHDQDLASIKNELDGQHNDWKRVDQMAAKIHAELGVEAGRLRGELQRAQRLVAIFQDASDAVFEATRWTSGFGTRIFGSPGSGDLERARNALNRGDYSAMAELARSAKIAAVHAIQRAQREVYRRQREQARQAEAARRRRRRSSINIGGGGFGGISRGGGGISRGGGSSRRSSSGSGSGFSRSGW